MGDIQSWKLFVDLFLMGTLIYFAARMLRSPHNPRIARQVAELEASLRTIIREAEAAGRGLNDQLLKRQESLERVLFDLDAAEQRGTTRWKSIDESKGALELSIAKAQRCAQQLEETIRHAQALPPVTARPVQSPILEPLPVVEIPVPPPFEVAVRTAPELSERGAGQNMPVDLLTERRETTPRDLPHAKAEPARRQQSSPLDRAVEREVAPPKGGTDSRTLGTDLARIFGEAEEMLRAGKDLLTVARSTKIPVEQLKLLSQLVAQEQVGSVTKQGDPRLGVLGKR